MDYKYKTATVSVGGDSFVLREATGMDEFRIQSILVAFGGKDYSTDMWLAVYYFSRFVIRLADDESRERAVALGIAPEDNTNEEQVLAAFNELMENPRYAGMIRDIVNAIDLRLETVMGEDLEPPTPANEGKD